MEGTQPSAAGGDGAPTAMVAVPGLSGALTQGYTFLGGSGTVSMEASLRLRAKDYAAHDRWLVNLLDTRYTAYAGSSLDLRRGFVKKSPSAPHTTQLTYSADSTRSGPG